MQSIEFQAHALSNRHHRSSPVSPVVRHSCVSSPRNTVDLNTWCPLVAPPYTFVQWIGSFSGPPLSTHTVKCIPKYHIRMKTGVNEKNVVPYNVLYRDKFLMNTHFHKTVLRVGADWQLGPLECSTYHQLWESVRRLFSFRPCQVRLTDGVQVGTGKCSLISFYRAIRLDLLINEILGLELLNDLPQKDYSRG